MNLDLHARELGRALLGVRALTVMVWPLNKCLVLGVDQQGGRECSMVTSL